MEGISIYCDIIFKTKPIIWASGPEFLYMAIVGLIQGDKHNLSLLQKDWEVLECSLEGIDESILKPDNLKKIQSFGCLGPNFDIWEFVAGNTKIRILQQYCEVLEGLSGVY